ncbi:TetR family transcriptional regulator [Streptomyces sp. NPDC097981]|uniref:TetR/AcrR family transcriptional regulator n=1 Tax=Streptomyces sp. NPDC097981 TaxID=3155428 RepID=UPI00331F6E7D
MSPRGVAIEGVRDRLFEAAERLLAREGPGALTSRAVTGEAGCAKGLLHNHFADFDEFVAHLVLRRFRLLAAAAEALPAQAGLRTVAENMTAGALALLDAHGPAFAALALARPAASARIQEAWRQGEPGLDSIEASFAAYLRAEQHLGRLPETEDCGALALAVVATAHHLLMTARPGAADPRERLRGLVAALANRKE